MVIKITYLHSVHDFTGRGLFTLRDRVLLFSNTNTDMFDDMFAVIRESPSRLILRSAMVRSYISTLCKIFSAAVRTSLRLSGAVLTLTAKVPYIGGSS